MNINEGSNTLGSSGGLIMDVAEAERVIEGLKPFSIKDIGSSAWMAQHQVIEKLNLQAHQNAMGNAEEFITETLLTFEKLPVLVHELVAVEAWRENVFPLIAEPLAKRNSMRAYFMLYQETVLVNLLEVVMYYDYAVEAIGDSLVDLLDYVCRRVVALAANTVRRGAAAVESKSAKELAADMEARSAGEDLQERAAELAFKTGVVCVTLLRYFTEHISKLPLTVINRVLETHDVMVMVVPLIENPPWTRRTTKGTWQKYKDAKWEDVAPSDLLRLTKLEGQAWLCLFNLMCDAECRKKYYFNSHRKNSILRVRKYLNDVLLDQLPVLSDVQRYMDELTVMEAPAPTAFAKGLILEQEPEIYEALRKGADWKAIGRHQLGTIPVPSEDSALKALADVYGNEAFDDLLGEAKCHVCGKTAVKRCSKCRNAWYCGRKCQVKDWKQHKKLCALVSKATSEADAIAAASARKPAKATAPLIEAVE